jgi:hypothetical protein
VAFADGDGDERQLCLLTGESGSGKSAALARFVRRPRGSVRQSRRSSSSRRRSPRSSPPGATSSRWSRRSTGS